MGAARNRLIDWWRRRRLTRPRVDRVVHYPNLPDVPETLSRRVLAVCGAPEAPKWAAFECPCGRHHRIEVSLQREHRPNWKLRLVDGRPSLKPSVDSHLDFRCHFWLKDGRIFWVKDRR